MAWFKKRQSKPARAKPARKRRFSLKAGAKVFLAAHLALATQYPPSIYEFRLQDMSADSVLQQFNRASKRLGAPAETYPFYQDLPAAYRGVLDRSAPAAELPGGEDFYNTLPDRYKADTLNLFAKSAATKLPDGTFVLDHLISLREIDQDRIFAEVDAAMAPEMDAGVQSHIFNHRGKVDSSLHHGHGRFQKYASYKTYDRKGNLDITLSHDNDNNWMAEIDIDYYKGARHFVQEVLYNHTFDQRTDPYHVAKILRNDQGIDPGHRPK